MALHCSLVNQNNMLAQLRIPFAAMLLRHCCGNLGARLRARHRAVARPLVASDMRALAWKSISWQPRRQALLHRLLAVPAAALAGSRVIQLETTTSPSSEPKPSKPKPTAMDFTALVACANELRSKLVPAKMEQVIMSDKTALSLRLRTAQGSSWLTVCWHPVAARVCIASGPPARGSASEGYSLSEVVSTKLQGLVLVGVDMPQAWERVVALRFAGRPGEPPLYSLYCEVMARYSNLVLADAQDTILACAQQVGGAMSSMRLLQTGRQYTLPPITLGVPPDSGHTLQLWRELVQGAAKIVFDAAAANAERQASHSRASTRNGSSSSTGASSKSTSKSPSSRDGSTGDSGAMTTGAPVTDGSSSNPRATSSLASMVPPGMEPTADFDQLGASADLASSSSDIPEPDAMSSNTAPQVIPSHTPLHSAIHGNAHVPHGTVAEGMARAFHGVSPGLASEMCGAAGCDPHTSPSSLSDRTWEALWQQWQSWQSRVASHHFAATSDEGLTRFSMLGHLPVAHASPCALVDAYYSRLQMAEQHAALHQRLLTAVGQAIKKAKGRVAAFRSQLKDSSGADVLQRQGDMLTANLYRISQGDKEVVVEDWDTGEPVTIPIDPLKPPVQTAEAIYKRARKLRRAVEVVEPLLQAAQEEVGYLEEVEEAVQQLKVYRGLEDAQALKEVQDELVAGKYMRAPPDAELAARSAAKAKKAAAKAGKKGSKAGAGAAGSGALGGFRVFKSPSGYTVLVGRNNTQNDELSNRVAGPEDLWLHIRGRPGSHVVIRVPPGKGRSPQLGDPDVQFAADLAAFFSKGRQDSKCDVIVAKAGQLKKPKGAKPGQILVTKELGNVIGRPAQSAGALEAAEAPTSAAVEAKSRS